MLVMTAMAATAKSNAVNDAAVGPEKNGEIEDGPDEQESADVGFLADVVFRGRSSTRR